MKKIGYFLVFHLVAGLLPLGLFGQFSWDQHGPGGGEDVVALAVHPSDPDIVYMAGESQGIFRTIDGGDYWENVNYNLPNLMLGTREFKTHEIIIDPQDPNIVLIATTLGLFSLQVDMDTWQLLYPEFISPDLESTSVGAIALDPVDPQIMYMGLGMKPEAELGDGQIFQPYTGPTGLFKAQGNRWDWSRLDLWPDMEASIIGIEINPLNHDHLVVASTDGIYLNMLPSTARIIRSAFPFTIDGVEPANGMHEINDLDETYYPFWEGDSIIVWGFNRLTEEFHTEFVYGETHDGTHLRDLLDLIELQIAAYSTVTLIDGDIQIEDHDYGHSSTIIYLYGSESNTGEMSLPYFEVIQTGFEDQSTYQFQVWHAGFPFTTDGESPADASTEINDLDEVSNPPLSPGDVIVMHGSDVNGNGIETEFVYGPEHDGTTVGAIIDKGNNSDGGWGSFAELSLESGYVVIRDRWPGASETSMNWYASPSNTGSISIPYFVLINAGQTATQDWRRFDEGLEHDQILALDGEVIDGEFQLAATLKTLYSSESIHRAGGVYVANIADREWQNVTWGDTSFIPLGWETDEFIDYPILDLDVSTESDSGYVLYVGRSKQAGQTEPGLHRTREAPIEELNWEVVPQNVLTGWINPQWIVNDYVSAFATNPDQSNDLLIGGKYLIRSFDGGHEWWPLYTHQSTTGWFHSGWDFHRASTIAFHPWDNAVLYTGFNTFGLFKSRDGGQSFSTLDPTQAPQIDGIEGIETVTQIELHPYTADLFVSRHSESSLTSGGLFRSLDGGQHFHSLTDSLPSGRMCFTLQTDADDPEGSIITVAIYGVGVFRTEDEGRTWSTCNAGLGANAARVWALAQHPDDPDILLLGLKFPLGGYDGSYCTFDGADSWVQILSIPPGSIHDLEISANGLFYASITDLIDGDQTGGLFRSNDNGENWECINDHPLIHDLAINPDNPNVMALAAERPSDNSEYESQVLLSADNGGTWIDMTAGVEYGTPSLVAFAPLTPEKLWVGTQGGGFWQTELDYTALVDQPALPARFTLKPNYPNPFNAATTFEIGFPERDRVNLVIYDILGRQVYVDDLGILEPGWHTTHWNGSDQRGELVSSGVYLARFVGENETKQQKLLLLK